MADAGGENRDVICVWVTHGDLPEWPATHVNRAWRFDLAPGFGEGIATSVPPRVSPDEALRVLRIIGATHASREARRTI
jgi:hypothetical protein